MHIFTDSQTSLHAIQHELQRHSHIKHHHHKSLIAAIVSKLHYKIRLGLLPIIIHKIRGHKNIRGNDLEDTAAKRLLTSVEDIPGHRKLTVATWKHAEQPAF
jgi:hypothetical protein